MPEYPTVTVIIPTYNREEIISSTVESVLNQTVPVEKIIIVDDGSSDNTQAAIKDLIASTSAQNKIIYIHQHNQGKSVAINNALQSVDTEWIAFNDSDDQWATNKLELQFEALSKFNSCKACFTDTKFGTSDLTTASISGLELPNEQGILENAAEVMASIGHGIMMQSVVVHASIMAAIGGFDPTLRVSQDSDFLFRVSLETPIAYINKPLVILDREAERSARLTVKHPMNSLFRLKLRVYMVNKWVALSKAKMPSLLPILNKNLSSSLSFYANQLLLENQHQEGQDCLLEAFKVNYNFKILIKWALIKLLPNSSAKLLIKS